MSDMPLQQIFTPDEVKLAEHAEVIRTLGKRAVADIIEIGSRLTEAKAIAGHGNWLPWLEREFGWSGESAVNFMRVAQAAKSVNFTDFNVPVSSLYRLAAPSTPPEVIEAVAESSARGETFTHAQVETMIADAADKKAEAKVEAERARVESKISELTADYERRTEELRAEFADEAKGSLSIEQIKQLVEEAVKPLKEQIEHYKARLEDQPKFKMPARSAEHGRASSALLDLAKAIKAITPAHMIEYYDGMVTLTGVATAGDGVLIDLRNAQAIAKWLKRFIEAMAKRGENGDAETRI